MLEILFSVPMILVYSVLFGATLKIADLLNEHGLRLFKGNNLLFGFICGIFGAAIIISNNLLANFFLALLIHWVLRYRIDHLNHGITGTIMFLAIVYILPVFAIDWLLFLSILVIYGFHGLFNDAADRKEIRGIWAKYFESNSHYFTIPIILTVINPVYWIVFATSVLHIVSYETTKHYGMKRVKQ